MTVSASVSVIVAACGPVARSPLPVTPHSLPGLVPGVWCGHTISSVPALKMSLLAAQIVAMVCLGLVTWVIGELGTLSVKWEVIISQYPALSSVFVIKSNQIICISTVGKSQQWLQIFLASASINLEVSKQGGTERLFPFKISFIRKIMLSIKTKG